MVTMNAVDIKNTNLTLLIIRHYNFYFIKLATSSDCNRWVEKMTWNEQKACFFSLPPSLYECCNWHCLINVHVDWSLQLILLGPCD